MKRLTIFTPTYNRGYILPKLYESLCAQTCQDFEWLIVDDGSTDNTRELVQQWMKDDKLDISYYYQENSGKMMAHNKAVLRSDAELFMCVDSDDYLCSKDVVRDCLVFWDRQKQRMGESFSNIGCAIAYKQTGDRTDTFPKDMEVCHLSELYSSGYKGEAALIFKRDVLEKYPFPYFAGEKFVTDVYVYDQIDQAYKYLLFPYNVQYYRYHEDGYSHNYMQLLFDNPIGYRAYKEQCVRFRKKGYLKNIICYEALTLRIGDWKLMPKGTNVLLMFTLLPLGVLKYFYDSYRLSRIKK